MNVLTERLPLGERWVEVVERKGIGHPDTICDALAEELSVRLSLHYLERFGAVLHHNVDKALLVGGSSRPAFGGGEVVDPIQIFLAGRATLDVGAERVPIQELAALGAREWLKAHLHEFERARVDVRCLVRPGSEELRGLVDRGASRANDTSIGVGFAPLTPLEEVVLAVSAQLESMSARGAPEIGEDVKILAVRHGGDIELTVACAFVDRHVPSLSAYIDARRSLARLVERIASERIGREVRAVVNAADDDDSGAVYLTVTGTSAESGDDGQVGRGNRVTGLITPCRPMTLEASAGKNPIAHVGKLYNVAAQSIAEAIVERTNVAGVECTLVSRIGDPLDDPRSVSLRIRTDDERVVRRAVEIARSVVATIPVTWERLLQRAARLY